MEKEYEQIIAVLRSHNHALHLLIAREKAITDILYKKGITDVDELIGVQDTYFVDLKPVIEELLQPLST